jgi:hypothetical protein
MKNQIIQKLNGTQDIHKEKDGSMTVYSDP